MGIYEDLFGKPDAGMPLQGLARDERIEQRLRKVFDELDRDGDGSVNVDDLRKVFGELHLHGKRTGAGDDGNQELKDADFQYLLELADVDKDGDISFREFALLFQRWADFSRPDAEINLRAVASRWALDYGQNREEIIQAAAAAAANQDLPEHPTTEFDLDTDAQHHEHQRQQQEAQVAEALQ